MKTGEKFQNELGVSWSEMLLGRLSLFEAEHCLGEGSIPDYQSQINSECQRDIIGSQTASAKIRSRKGNSPDHQLKVPKYMLSGKGCGVAQQLGC